MTVVINRSERRRRTASGRDRHTFELVGGGQEQFDAGVARTAACASRAGVADLLDGAGTASDAGADLDLGHARTDAHVHSYSFI
jgi:hypothetical protein